MSCHHYNRISSHFRDLTAREKMTYNNFKISLVVFMLNIITNPAIRPPTDHACLVPQVFVPYCACWLDETSGFPTAGQGERRRWVQPEWFASVCDTESLTLRSELSM